MGELQLTNQAVIREIMERHGFTFSKVLGQNFIINPTVCPRIAEMGGAAPGVGVLEIGAGVGVLTAELARRAQKVVCVEIDSRLLPVLAETLAPFSNVTIINEDVLKADLHAILAREFAGMPVVVCANLPYYITSPILMTLLEQRLPVRSITVMVQKEAAQRICAQPGTRQSGAISAAVRYYSLPKVLFQVSRGSFLPAPEVDSSVIRLDVLPKPGVETLDPDRFFAVVKGAFAQRRKTILNTLSASLGLSKEEMRRVLAAAGVAENARAEELPLEAFGRIADCLAGGQPPERQGKAAEKKTAGQEEELRRIMTCFAESGWDLIALPARAWLQGKGDTAVLEAALDRARMECGSCGCQLDPLYKRALELRQLWDRPSPDR